MSARRQEKAWELIGLAHKAVMDHHTEPLSKALAALPDDALEVGQVLQVVLFQIGALMAAAESVEIINEEEVS